ncbi:MAG: hypothetical protein GEU97_11065 [Actinophytocola sp.]|nr:hypothetical protein [Actinophytocola sp.]
MDPLHERLARVGLSAIGRHGFCLAGGYAVQAHGLINRRSEDVDLFTTMDIEGRFPDAVQALLDAYGADGLDATVTRDGATFARLEVADPADGAHGRVELGVDWRAYPPAQLEIGPVLHADDAVANKVCALFGRGAVRDYIDVDGIMRSGRYSMPCLLELAVEHDPGFRKDMFADALRAVRRLPHSAFAAYGMSDEDAAALVTRTVGYAKQVNDTAE